MCSLLDSVGMPSLSLCVYTVAIKSIAQHVQINLKADHFSKTP